MRIDFGDALLWIFAVVWIVLVIAVFWGDSTTEATKRYTACIQRFTPMECQLLID